MRYMRKLVLLSIAAVAALAVIVPAASATAIEVEDALGVHCPALVFVGDDVSGGCEADLVSQGVQFRVFGATIMTCDSVGTLRIDEDGDIAINDLVFSSCGVANTARECASSEAHQGSPNDGEVPWRSVSAATETAADLVSVDLGICYVMFSSGRCEGPTEFTIDTSTTPYVLSADHAQVGFSSCTIGGDWELEDGSFTITHL